jgi:two-component system chemotaxis response regulator CheB
MQQRDVIAIGGSLGAVDALTRLFQELPADLTASMFIVVHVGAHGNNLLAGILDEKSAMRITTAQDGETLERGHVYIAPADRHLLVIGDKLRLGNGPRENLARPAIDPLFRSVGVSYGPRAIAVVLTGMLNDGASGLADLKRCGGITVVQNPTDAVAAEMPWGALQASDVDYRAPLADMAKLLTHLSTEEAEPAPGVPEEIKLEIDIALGHRTDSEVTARLGDPVALSCPACGGVMSQIRRSPPLRFRCQVGHAYTAETFAAEQEGGADEAMRVALRIIEERAVLSERMAGDARASGRHAAARASDARATEARRYEALLREAIAREAD